jgi:hypothetical protein
MRRARKHHLAQTVCADVVAGGGLDYSTAAHTPTGKNDVEDGATSGAYLFFNCC